MCTRGLYFSLNRYLFFTTTFDPNIAFRPANPILVELGPPGNFFELHGLGPNFDQTRTTQL